MWTGRLSPSGNRHVAAAFRFATRPRARYDRRDGAMRLPRFRVRTLMIAVAVVAAGIGSLQTARRWSVFRTRLEFHAARAERFSRIAAEDSTWVDSFRQAA